MNSLQTHAAFAHYEKIRHRLPQAHFPTSSTRIDSLNTFLHSGDGFFLDAFGILNVGAHAIPLAKELIATLRKHQKPFFIVSNSASVPKEVLVNFFRELGFDFTALEIITSREVLWHHLLPNSASQWGVIAQNTTLLEHPLPCVDHEDERFLHSDAFLFLSTTTWDEALHVKWKASLHVKPKTIWIANPDITAPRGNHCFSKEPGFYTLNEEDHLFEQMRFIGKPFDAIFQYAIQRAHDEWQISKERIVMMGDTLHTDILGACAAGLQTLLVEEYGFFAGLDPTPFIEQSGITPQFRLKNYQTLFNH
ncbi:MULTISPECIES: HAD hydrolase-like protein [unclassified Sulfurospirillum]|uniref:HAD-IIA family hydrolase n=1 Tax=unclassified Sulfurospirillum TaxID=2618290 RepID=UPI00068A6CBC|nr:MULTISPECIES: HAD hydrolase-like protein [unclassified Sulfurospirillum]